MDDRFYVSPGDDVEHGATVRIDPVTKIEDGDPGIVLRFTTVAGEVHNYFVPADFAIEWLAEQVRATAERAKRLGTD